MSKNYETWHKIKYVLFALIPWLLFKGLAMLISSIAQVVVSTQYIKNGGTMDGVQAYLIDYFSDSNVSIMITAIVHIVSIIVGLIIMFKFLKKNDFGSPFKAFPRLTFPGTIILMAGSCFLTLIAMSVYAVVAPDLMEGYTDLIQSSGLANFTVTSILATLVIAPVNEEILFRGISFDLLKKAGLKFWAVNIIQALLFGITHMSFINAFYGGIKYLNIVQGTYAFILGLFLGYLRERTGSVWTSILGHMVFNFVGTFVTSWLAGMGETFAGMVMIIGGVILTILGFVLMERKRGKVTNE